MENLVVYSFMGFNKRYLSTVEDVKKEIERNGLESFIKSIIRCDAVIGPAETIDFVDSIVEEFKKKEDNVLHRKGEI